MIKTELFIEVGSLGSVHAYQKFIKDNQRIKIISVNLLNDKHVLLTYQEV